MAGKLYTFEGLDGSGKSTISLLFYQWLQAQSRFALLTNEPCEQAAAGKWLREALRKEIATTPLTLARGFAFNRIDHCERFITPSLERGMDVVCDRYLLSSLVYNTEGGVKYGDVLKLNQDVLKPDLTFFLHASEATCVERMKARGAAPELFEARLHEHFNKYLQVIDHARTFMGWKVCVVDADLPAEDVLAQVVECWQKEMAT